MRSGLRTHSWLLSVKGKVGPSVQSGSISMLPENGEVMSSHRAVYVVLHGPPKTQEWTEGKGN